MEQIERMQRKREKAIRYGRWIRLEDLGSKYIWLIRAQQINQPAHCLRIEKFSEKERAIQLPTPPPQPPLFYIFQSGKRWLLARINTSSEYQFEENEYRNGEWIQKWKASMFVCLLTPLLSLFLCAFAVFFFSQCLFSLFHSFIARTFHCKSARVVFARISPFDFFSVPFFTLTRFSALAMAAIVCMSLLFCYPWSNINNV